jgi:hypothetical protein
MDKNFDLSTGEWSQSDKEDGVRREDGEELATIHPTTFNNPCSGLTRF